MKTNLIKPILLLLILVNCNLFAQEKAITFQFRMCIDHGKLALENDNGNNWTSLFIQKRNFELNQNGMLWKDKKKEEIANSNYIIGVKRNGNQVVLTGIKGVSWKKLTIEVPNKSNYSTITNLGKL